jgi:hypothetical protein
VHRDWHVRSRDAEFVRFDFPEWSRAEFRAWGGDLVGAKFVEGGDGWAFLSAKRLSTDLTRVALFGRRPRYVRNENNVYIGRLADALADPAVILACFTASGEAWTSSPRACHRLLTFPGGSGFTVSRCRPVSRVIAYLLRIRAREVTFHVSLAELLGGSLIPLFVRGFHFERYFKSRIVVPGFRYHARSLYGSHVPFEVSFLRVKEFPGLFNLAGFGPGSPFNRKLRRDFIRWPADPFWPMWDAYGKICVFKETDGSQIYRLVFFQVTCGAKHVCRMPEHPAGKLLQWAIEHARGPCRPLLIYVVAAEHFEKFKLTRGTPKEGHPKPQELLKQLETWVMRLDVTGP